LLDNNDSRDDKRQRTENFEIRFHGSQFRCGDAGISYP